MFNKVELRRIKKRLPTGALTNIQKKAGVSYPTILKFFKGESQNEKVVAAVIAEYKEFLASVEALKECASK